MSTVQFPELGFYALPGHTLDPKPIFQQIRTADEIGLGSTWIAERLNTKEIGVLSGVAAALSPRMAVVAGLMGNLPMRNPLVVAGYASTMAMLSDNRFALGLGKGVAQLADMTCTPRVTMKIIEDTVDMLRRLWRGESVSYEGPAGKLRNATLSMALDIPPPIIIGLLGWKTAYWAGRVADGVVLNSMTSTRAVREYVRVIRAGARDSGRDPASVKVWTILMTACEVPEETMLRTIIRRMNTYILWPAAFDWTCEVNGWDKAVAAGIRQTLAEIDGPMKSGGTLGDEFTTRDRDKLRRMRDAYPSHWIHDGSAVGTAAECAPLIRERFEAGADGILFHGTSPDDLPPLLGAWRRIRPAQFDQRSVVPGR
ncbi:MAG TPA: TIGR03857 family LLM class F420-dependent oxidoreductase [Dongiaceae bacterium]